MYLISSIIVDLILRFIAYAIVCVWKNRHCLAIDKQLQTVLA